MKGYAENVNREGSILGDTLETAVEYGEKFDELVTKYRSVSHSYYCWFIQCSYVHLIVGSCLATKVFIGNLPATRRVWVIIK